VKKVRVTLTREHTHAGDMYVLYCANRIPYIIHDILLQFRAMLTLTDDSYGEYELLCPPACLVHRQLYCRLGRHILTTLGIPRAWSRTQRHCHSSSIEYYHTASPTWIYNRKLAHNHVGSDITDVNFALSQKSIIGEAFRPYGVMKHLSSHPGC
jgi:hypothetical protein